MDKKIVFTATVYPATDGNPPTVMVTCAPEGELPSVYKGGFSDLHRLMDQAWVEINTRKPLVIKSSTHKVGKVEVGETKEPEPANEATTPDTEHVEKVDEEVGDGDAA